MPVSRKAIKALIELKARRGRRGTRSRINTQNKFSYIYLRKGTPISKRDTLPVAQTKRNLIWVRVGSAI